MMNRMKRDRMIYSGLGLHWKELENEVTSLKMKMKQSQWKMLRD